MIVMGISFFSIINIDIFSVNSYFTNELNNEMRIQETTDTDSLSLIFNALADPTRRAILQLLSTGEKSVNELANPFPMSLPAISKHLKVLERAGLVERSRDAQWRPCKIQTKPLQDASEWLAPYRKIWESRLNQLDSYLTDIQERDMEEKNDLGLKQFIGRKHPKAGSNKN